MCIMLKILKITVSKDVSKLEQKQNLSRVYIEKYSLRKSDYSIFSFLLFLKYTRHLDETSSVYLK